MKLKNNLKTIRFNQQELQTIESYLGCHDEYQSISNLFRVALWSFMSVKNTKLRVSRPSFLWDYDLTEMEMREVLQGPQQKRLWLVGKILEHAHWDEVWYYLSLEQIKEDLPKVRITAKTKAHWEFTLNTWSQMSETN